MTCEHCLGEGSFERAATPDEVDAGCELGVAFDPCPYCTPAPVGPANPDQLEMFPGLEPAPAPPHPHTGAPGDRGDSYTVRLTRRREAELAAGRHPTTKLPLLEPIGEKACADCAHLFAHTRNRTYWKCRQVEFTFGPSSDVRVSWPACIRFAEKET